MLVKYLPLFAVVLNVGCVTTTTIISDPPGAKVLDERGRELGVTPYLYISQEGTSFDTETVQLTKRGYAPATVVLKRSEVNWGHLAGSVAAIVCLLPTTVLWIAPVFWLWSAALVYPEETHVTMHSSRGSGGDEPAVLWIEPVDY